MSEPRVVNINVGILGHVDSGKTSLAKALSTMSSTAAFDKNPQSQERGITLDLGFSAFMMDMPERLKTNPDDKLQVTLVDCPGHASLIRTVLGGAQIIDLMILVVDVTKGIQTQTAEGLIVGEILTNDMVVVINKVDMLPESEREKSIEKMKIRLRKTFQATKFGEVPMIAVAACPGADPSGAPLGLSEFLSTFSASIKIPQRNPDGPFLFAIDHCFAIRGQGTVLTGTILSGSVQVNQTIELPDLKMQKKVKSMQMFKKPIQMGKQGDRLGICVTQLDSDSIERGIACAPGTVPTLSAAIVSLRKIRYFKSAVATKAKFHVTVGHTTTLATAVFFGFPQSSSASGSSSSSSVETFRWENEYLYQEELYGSETTDQPQWAFLEFEKPITCPLGSVLIGSKLDTDVHTTTCRIAFHGTLQHAVDTESNQHRKLKIFKYKKKEGSIDRVRKPFLFLYI
eukprot:TRINITY_DN3588_c0_g1_i2.p1 TRINITY_DN3588_c0_g1~~TRINITY_DN3588_c0_g1_i2.p1  ORF type:complete len:456 (-),score=94.69 TRINITY_DN3588_c0_g1_i2:427-1794(-)